MWRRRARRPFRRSAPPPPPVVVAAHPDRCATCGDRKPVDGHARCAVCRAGAEYPR